jgi:SAM-dependent methyltransferase
MTPPAWEWDPTLYAGSARYYAQGRVPYSPELVECLVEALELDGRGRLLDLGCGPGSLTLLLAEHFEQATGLDADAGMLAEGARRAARAGITTVDWLHRRAEDLPVEVGPVRVVTLAQSFHWMDRSLVARRLQRVLAPGGSLVHLHASTHAGIEGDGPLPHPRPPRRDIDALVKRYLGPQRRAGRGILPENLMPEPERGLLEAEVYSAAGFAHRRRLVVPGFVVERSIDDIVASVFSLSSATPRLFGDRVADFEADLRVLLRQANPEGRYSEQMRESAVDIWSARGATAG